MTRVTIKCAAVKGVFALYGSPNSTTDYLVEGAGFIPMELEADNIGDAVNKFLNNITQLRRTPEATAKAKARGVLIQKRLQENRQKQASANGRGSNRNKLPTPQATPDVATVS